MLATKIKKCMLNINYQKFGRCNICGRYTIFACTDSKTARNGMTCIFCRSSSRKRHVAKAIIENVYENKIHYISEIKEDKIIYNTECNDAFAKIIKNIICSDYLPDKGFGNKIGKNIYSQNLESLTFDDNFFDLVISEDVFEHVRNDAKGFKEIYRVLKKGGFHIFTVPFNFDRPTLHRVECKGDEDIFLLPPEYHGDPIKGKILAYRKYGIDMYNLLESIGFKTKVDVSKYTDKKYGIFDSYVFISQKI